MSRRPEAPKNILAVLNQLYELEQKVQKQADDPTFMARNIRRMKEALGEPEFPALDADGSLVRIGLFYECPLGQPFKATRTDLDVSISGEGTEDLVVVEVIRPIIRASVGQGMSYVVQNGRVIVESRKGA